jgi:hypothetical protein
MADLVACVRYVHVGVWVRPGGASGSMRQVHLVCSEAILVVHCWLLVRM